MGDVEKKDDMDQVRVDPSSLSDTPVFSVPWLRVTAFGTHRCGTAALVP